jgi:hypothetical protein
MKLCLEAQCVPSGAETGGWSNGAATIQLASIQQFAGAELPWRRDCDGCAPCVPDFFSPY